MQALAKSRALKSLALACLFGAAAFVLATGLSITHEELGLPPKAAVPMAIAVFLGVLLFQIIVEVRRKR
jgi:hypothetical protein